MTEYVATGPAAIEHPEHPIGREVSETQIDAEIVQRAVIWAINSMREYVATAGEIETGLGEKTTIHNILAGLDRLRNDVPNLQSSEDFRDLFDLFVKTLEKEPFLRSTFQLIYQVQNIVEDTQGIIRAILSGATDSSYKFQFQRYLETPELDATATYTEPLLPVRILRGFGVGFREIRSKVQAENTMFVKKVLKNIWNQIFTTLPFLGGRMSSQAGWVLETLLPPSVMIIMAGLVFTAYTIYIALLLSSQEGKATRGATALDGFAGAVANYAQHFPEASQYAEALLLEIKKAINETGTFHTGNLIDLLAQVVRNDDKVSSIQHRGHMRIREHFSALQEACRPGLSNRTQSSLRLGGRFLSVLAALSGEDAQAGGIMAVISAFVNGSMQEVIRDLDRLIGPERGSMGLTDQPLDIALTQVRFRHAESGMQRKAADRFRQKASADQDIVHSVYRSFRAIFDRWYESTQTVKYCKQSLLGEQLAASGSTNMPQRVTAALGAAEELERSLSAQPDVKRPEFLSGPAVSQAGTLDPERQLAFRHDDDFLRQLAILEAVRERVRSNADLDDGEKTGAAVSMLNGWIQQLNSQRLMAQREEFKTSEPKSREREIENAVEAIAAEIVANIRERGEARYVRRREAGSGKIAIETANRDSDWTEENREKLLTPIHTGVIRRLQTQIQEDSGNQEKYLAVIQNINETREQEGLPKIELDDESSV